MSFPTKFSRNSKYLKDPIINNNHDASFARQRASEDIDRVLHFYVSCHVQ